MVALQLQILQRNTGVPGFLPDPELQRLDLAANQLIYRLHIGASHGIPHGAHIAGNRVGRNVLRGNHALHAQLIHHALQALVVDLGYDLGYMTAFRVHRHDDIFLIHTGQGYKGVCLGDSFLLQKLVIGGIAMDNRRLGKQIAQLHAALFVHLYNLDLHTQLQKLAAQIIGHPAAATDHDIFSLADDTLGKLQELLNLRMGSCDVDLVAGLGHKITIGNIDLPVPLHRTDQHFDLMLFI